MRKKYRRLQDWEVEAIAQAYLKGEKLLALAAEFDVSESTISLIAKRRGYLRRTRNFPQAHNKALKELPFQLFRRELKKLREENVRLRSKYRGTHADGR